MIFRHRRHIHRLFTFLLCATLFSGCTADTPHPTDADTPSTSTIPTTTTAFLNDLPTQLPTTDRTLPPAQTLLDVEPMCQYPAYPTGCESVTAVMALRHAGIPITVDEFIDRHLVCSNRFLDINGLLYGPDPYSVFVGDPRSQYSYGCMAPVIENALISCVGDEKEVINTTGNALRTLCRTYIDEGIPVIVWATMEMRAVTDGNSWRLMDGRSFTWPAGEHCLLLVGYGDNAYFFNDPLYGTVVAFDKADVDRSYHSLGEQSLVIR